jgi:hypothetical protein
MHIFPLAFIIATHSLNASISFTQSYRFAFLYNLLNYLFIIIYLYFVVKLTRKHFKANLIFFILSIEYLFVILISNYFITNFIFSSLNLYLCLKYFLILFRVQVTFKFIDLLLNMIISIINNLYLSILPNFTIYLFIK